MPWISGQRSAQDPKDAAGLIDPVPNLLSPQVLRFTTVSQSGELHGPMEIPLEVEALLRGESASHP